jgi:hypothetical protein
MQRSLALIALGLSALALAAAGSGAVAAPPGAPPATPTPVCGPAWQVVASPDAPESSENVLRRVAAAGPDDIWAVGYDLGDSGVRETLTLRYDGARWRIVNSPNLGDADNTLLGVAARDGVVWAVGSANDGSDETVALRWTGAVWQPVGSPNVGEGDNALRGVAIAAADDVWAVGASPAGALIEHWDGQTWQVAPAPADPRALNAVAVAAPADVWAVGDAGLIEHWDGAAWRIVAAPGGGALRDVAAGAPDDVWAVGVSASRTLIEHWDGQTWSVTPSPNGGQTEDALAGVAVAGPAAAWAVGSYRDYFGRSQALIEAWDGAAWRVATSPVLGPYFNELFDVAAAGPADAWAVGYRDERRYGPDETLTEHLADPCPTPPAPSASPSPTPSPSPSATAPPSPTPVAPCPPRFRDVPPGAYFYAPVEDLVCEGVVSGYADDAFHPYADATRSQLVKIVALGLALPALTPAAGGYTFADTPPAQPFYPYIEAAARAGVVTGYACGGPREPCDAQARPYFRPYAPVTRGQIAKITVLAAGWPLRGGASGFADVPPDAPFHAYVATAACYDLISGYACGGPGEPCDAQARPYYRPGAGATRGQIAKIVDSARQAPAACAPAP